MADIPLKIFSPHDVTSASGDGADRWDSFGVRLLAQGDSWFSIGAMPPWATSNLLQNISLGFFACAINCAYPGRELSRMVDWKQNPGFTGLLAGKFAYRWNGILLSGGGNDLIAAAGVLPRHADGSPVPPNSRLFLKSFEWGHETLGASRYLSDAGWAIFAEHLAGQFQDVIVLRDQDQNRDVPLICHGYDYPMPRNAPASVLFGVGPWLYPAMVAYEIPESDWLAVSTELIRRLAALIKGIITDLVAAGRRNIHFVENPGTLVPATPRSTNPSNDWENEIHPSREGYVKLAALWRPVIEANLG